MDKPGVGKGPFTNIISLHLLKFANVGENLIHPLAIPMCQLVGMQVVCTFQMSTLAINNMKEKF